jgi:hypothetical protein
MESLLEAAFTYKAWGYSVIPVLENKKPPIHWKRYQSEIMSDRVIFQSFTSPLVRGLAIVCGDISGHFEALDFDDKNDPTRSIFNRFHAKLIEQHPALAQQLTSVLTKNKGHHLYFRCPEIGSSTVLAQRPSSLLELSENPNWRVRILIETLGNGGIVIVPPSQGYHFIHSDLRNVLTIQPAERTLMHILARNFNLYKAPVYLPTSFRRLPCMDDQPLTDFNRRGDVISLLQNHEWHMVYSTPERTYFRRPGKTEHYTSGNFHHQLRSFWVWSTSTNFVARKPHNPSAVYAFLRCKGNFSQAARELLTLGYGKPYKRA